MPTLSPFEPLPTMPAVHVARAGNLRCTAVTLQGGNVCVFNPVAGLEQKSLASLNDIGPVTHIIAPNHYHNKALNEYAEAFSTAKLCATQKAIPRLQKISGLVIDSYQEIISALPKHMQFIEPPGLKTGELWMRSKVKQSVCWFVVDALVGAKMTARSQHSNTVSIMGTFPKYGIEDAIKYYKWLRVQVKADQPTQVIPCHGSIAQSATLADDIDQLITSALNPQ